MVFYNLEREYCELLNLPPPTKPTPPPHTCKKSSVKIDYISRQIYCGDCYEFLGYFEDPSEEQLSNQVLQSFVIKQSTNGVKETFDDLGIELDPYHLSKIEQSFEEVTEGKIKKVNQDIQYWRCVTSSRCLLNYARSRTC